MACFRIFTRLAHLEQADHVAVVDVAVIAQRNAEGEAVVDAVLVDLAEVVVDAARRAASGR